MDGSSRACYLDRWKLRRHQSALDGRPTPVPEEASISFLRVERTTSLEAERYNKALGYRKVIRQRLKPWCGLGGQHRGVHRRKSPDCKCCLKFVTF